MSAKARPEASAAGHASSPRRAPATSVTSRNGTASATSGTVRPASALTAAGSVPETRPATSMPIPIAPNPTPAVFPTRAAVAARTGGKPHRGEHRTADCDGSAEPGGPLEQGAEPRGDEERLDPAVCGRRRERRLHDLELTRRDDELVEEHGGTDDPGDRPDPEGEAVGRREEREARGHAEGEDRDEEGDGEGARGGGVPAPAPDRERPEQEEDGRGGEGGVHGEQDGGSHGAGRSLYDARP